ncbi:hypothetical protein KC19_1G043900 [Ceratodon purpureus]|uniref:Uncharacterized protein n=1 Tax=Ceratodon purpureus TaxID=3225 RepID=A0A8T0J1D1_CERPU|nr:hypothetical protein KC19_1G043900 [Ceratodon purpureus]
MTSASKTSSDGLEFKLRIFFGIPLMKFMFFSFRFFLPSSLIECLIPLNPFNTLSLHYNEQ